jgi:hypothetical protein
MDLLALMPHEIVYALASAPDVNGDPSAVGTQATVRARIEAVTRRYRGQDGSEQVSQHTVWSPSAIPVGARIWCPSLGDDVTKEAQAREAVDVSQTPSIDGSQSLWRVLL